VHTGSRITGEGRHTVVAGYLAGIVVELGEIVGEDHQTHRINRSHTRHGSNDAEDATKFLV
jgi:hypothetical protein